MKNLLLLVLFAGFTWINTANAEAQQYTLVPNSSLQSQHDWDHIGTSFMINTVMYGISKQALHMDGWDARVFSFFTTMFITTLYSISSSGQNGPLVNGRDVGMNALGAGLSAGATWVFQFGESPKSLSQYEKEQKR